MATNRYGYTKGYTNIDPWPEGKSCDVRRKPEKKRRGQWGPRRQTEQAVAPHAPGTPPPDRSMTVNEEIQALVDEARALVANAARATSPTQARVILAGESADDRLRLLVLLSDALAACATKDGA